MPAISTRLGVWVARRQTDQIEYLKTVNRALMERLASSWRISSVRRHVN